MNIYSKKQRWKLVLSLLAILISVASVFITNKLVKELKSEETKKIEISTYLYVTIMIAAFCTALI